MSIEDQIARALEPLLRKVVREELARSASEDALTTGEAARFAKRSPKTIQAWVAAGALPARRRGRTLVILREDLQRYLAGETPEADPVVESLRRGA